VRGPETPAIQNFLKFQTSNNYWYVSRAFVALLLASLELRGYANDGMLLAFHDFFLGLVLALLDGTVEPTLDKTEPPVKVVLESTFVIR
jgi:hypothetical protein